MFVVKAELWYSGAFWQPPYRSYPNPPTSLEVLAARAGMTDDELRGLLHDAIQRRLRERGESWDALDVTLAKREHGR